MTVDRIASGGPTDQVRRYLQDAIAADKKNQEFLSALPASGEDQEVEALFRRQAQTAESQRNLLKSELDSIGSRGGAVQAQEEPAESGSTVAFVAPKAAFRASTPEERVAEALVTAFGAVNGSRAIYKWLESLSSDAGLTGTEQLARQIEGERNRTAGEIWSLISTRVKIAFNVLTAGETDPSISTRTNENSLI